MLASCSASNCRDLARNNADWYAARCLRLIDAFIGRCRLSSMFNDRCCSGFKLQRAKAELHVLARGIRNKAARAELRCGLPVGFVWGGGRYHPRALIGAFASPEICVRVSPRKRVWQRVKRGEIDASCQALTQERPRGSS
jgi:hypothetical protein